MYKEIKEINEQKDFNNITAWHKAGITGKGVVVWNTEGSGNHGDTVTRRIWDAAPDATILQAELSTKYDRNEIEYARVKHEGKTYDIEDFIKTFNVRVVTRSVSGGTKTDTSFSKLLMELKEKYKLVFFNSAGNESDDGCTASLPHDVAMLIGACDLVNGKPKRASYSSIGEELDFTNFTGIWSGTSFAAPYTAGMTALLLQARPNWTQGDVVRYFREHCMDLGTEGVDDYYGAGLIVLGEPITKREIIIPIDKDVMYVDGSVQPIDQPAMIDPRTNRTLVPLRAIAEAFGAEVEWDNDNRRVIIKM